MIISKSADLIIQITSKEQYTEYVGCSLFSYKLSGCTIVQRHYVQ